MPEPGMAESPLLDIILGSISQGILVFDADMRAIAYNARACALLELDPAFLATCPVLVDIERLQHRRGDFGTHWELLDPATRDHVVSGQADRSDGQYLRHTRQGTVLEVRTRMLPGGGMVRTYTDVSDYVQAQVARRRLDRLLGATQSLAQVGGWEVDVLADQVYWTAGVYQIMGVDVQQYGPTGVEETARRFFTVASAQALLACYTQAQPEQPTHDLELQAITATGRHIWVRMRGTSQWVGGSLVAHTSVLQDITQPKLAQAALLEAETRWKLALESTGDGVWDWHITGNIEFFSRRLVEMYGFREGEIPNLPKELDARTHPDDRAQMEFDRRQHLDGLTLSYMNEHRILCKDGSWKWVLSRGAVISRDADGRPLRMIGTHTDITERKRAEALVRRQAFFDTLTGLPNRRMLRDRLEQEIKKCKRDGQMLAILFIDLDHFKEVNDTLGHDNGDQLLVQAAQRIAACVRERDTVARMGGDEFTVLLTDVGASEQIEPVMQKLLDTLQRAFQLGNEQAFVSASIGVTLYPCDGTDIEDLYKNADQALYVAKGQGRNRFAFFTPELQAAAQNRARLASDLRTALAESQFHVLYQPIVELRTGAIHKGEALIRWQHPRRGPISPGEFIPVAESTGIIAEIGEWVFQQAAAQVAHWRQALHPHFQVSVNRSPVQFQKRLADSPSWGTQLQRMGLHGSALVVEITEGLLLDTNAEVVTQLLEFADTGVQVALDDFGTGYSSLAYLQKIDIDYIKIDQSFVRHLVPNSTEHSLCKAMIVMAHELGMKVIAEGVETALQYTLLREAGCDYGQGYLFARPLPAEQFEQLARQGFAAVCRA